MRVTPLPIFGAKCGNRSSETSRPLATSSLAVGRFAAKQGSLRSPRGRLVASLRLVKYEDLEQGLEPIENSEMF